MHALVSLFMAGPDAAVLSHQKDGGSRGPDFPHEAHPVRQPDIIFERPAEFERLDLPGHVLQPREEYSAPCHLSVT